MKKKRKKCHHKPMTDQMRQAAQLMYDGNRTGEIAAMLGVHRTTIWRWYNRRDFQRELSRIDQQFLRDMRRRIKKQIIESPEHQRELAARRKLPRLEKALEKAGNSGNMIEYRKAAAAYDKCFNEAYGACMDAFCKMFDSRNEKKPKKASKPKQYKVIFVD